MFVSILWVIGTVLLGFVLGIIYARVLSLPFSIGSIINSKAIVIDKGKEVEMELASTLYILPVLIATFLIGIFWFLCYRYCNEYIFYFCSAFVISFLLAYHVNIVNKHGEIRKFMAENGLESVYYYEEDDFDEDDFDEDDFDEDLDEDDFDGVDFEDYDFDEEDFDEEDLKGAKIIVLKDLKNIEPIDDLSDEERIKEFMEYQKKRKKRLAGKRKTKKTMRDGMKKSLKDGMGKKDKKK